MPTSLGQLLKLLPDPGLPQPNPYQAPNPDNPYPLTPDRWARRADGSPKGDGFLGPLLRPDGRALSSEISIGVNLGGREVEIPTLVPTLSPHEVKFLLTHDVSAPGFQMPPQIIGKAIDFALTRQRAGKPLFAQPGEAAMTQYPQIRRAGQKP